MQKSKYFKCVHIILLLSILVGSLSFSNFEVIASQESEDVLIEELFSELSNPDIANDDRQNVENQLDVLGYSEIPISEVPGEIRSGSNISPLSGTTTSSSGNVTWYKNTATTSYDNKDYTVETYRAVPKNEKSNLASQGKKSLSSSTGTAKGVKVASIIANGVSAISVPAIGITETIYDCIKNTVSTITGTTKIKNSDVQYSYDFQTQAVFKFVKRKNSNVATKLSLVANSCSGKVVCTGTTNYYRSNGTYTMESFKKTINVPNRKASYSNKNAIKHFLGKQTRLYYFVDSVDVKGLNDKRIIKYDPLAPINTVQVY